MSSIHGHEVLNMMIDSGESFSTASLITAIEQRFGADARFHTCSQQDLTAAQLVDFLASRGKFIPSDNDLNTHSSKICQH
ncbi:YecH family metal-binding protein [Hafnia paralvei]|uniref:YecH family metal-binding protein n=1 Tax=Hafnia paralvei TaxID=546367 RepID=UPI0010350879|nr:YecH family metal-binding protein [Hafnia paralvei]TBL96700.1 DUF2492 family protein [Hafnia paralvei]